MFDWRWDFTFDILPRLLVATGNTLMAAGFGYAIAVVLGLILALAQRTPSRVLTMIVRELVAEADAELIQLLKSANVNAVDRSGINDHGEVHVRIVANAALRILRYLTEAGIEPSVVEHHGLTRAGKGDVE